MWFFHLSLLAPFDYYDYDYDYDDEDDHDHSGDYLHDFNDEDWDEYGGDGPVEDEDASGVNFWPVT